MRQRDSVKVIVSSDPEGYQESNAEDEKEE
jgi:hypothetical protein